MHILKVVGRFQDAHGLFARASLLSPVSQVGGPAMRLDPDPASMAHGV